MIKMKNCQRRCDSMWLLSHLMTINFFILVSILTTLGHDSNSSASNYGEIFPAGHIILPIDQPLHLFCSINIEKAKADDYTIEDLIFLKEATIIDRSYTKRVNETTIRVILKNSWQSTDMYYCFLQKNTSSELEYMSMFGSSPVDDHKPLASTNSGIIPRTVLVGKSLVEVGPEPEKVYGFQCLSNDWDELECSWSVPKNIVFTYYTIEYSPQQWPSEKMPCPTDSDKTKNSCKWTLSSTPPYRRFIKTLSISVTGTNKYRQIRQDFTFDPYEHMELLLVVKDMHVVAKNSTSITVQWDMNKFQFFPKILQFQITLLSLDRKDKEEYRKLVWNETDTNRQRHGLYTVTKLTPNATYQLYLRVVSPTNLHYQRGDDVTDFTVQTDVDKDTSK